MAYTKKTTYRKRVTKRTYKRRASRGVKRPTIKRMIRREISRNNENKSRQLYISNFIPASSGSAPAVFNGSNVLPIGVDVGGITIEQGTGAGQRIGNRVKTKSLMFKGTWVPLPRDAITNAVPTPVQLKMWIFYDKSRPTDTPQPFTDFFQLGNATQGFQNNLVDLWAPVNTDKYRVLATRQFKLGTADYITPGTGNAYQNNNQLFRNNDFKMNCNFSWNLTKHMVKAVKFNDNSTIPMSRGIYLMVAFCAADGTFIGDDDFPVRMQYALDYHYEDA